MFDSLNCQVTRGTFSRWLTHGQHGRWSWWLAFVKQLFFSGIRWPTRNYHQLHCLEILKIYTRLGTWPFSRKSFNKKISIGPGNHSSNGFCQVSALSAWKQFFQKLPKKLRQKLCFSGCVFAGLTPLSETQPWLINRDGSSKRNLWKNESRPQVEPGNGTGAMLEPRRSNRNLPKFTKI